jgi:electron transport complex protein RnfG
MSERKEKIKTVLSVVAVAVICGFLTSGTDQATKSAIEANQRAKVASSITAIFPESKNYIPFAIDGNMLKKADLETPKKAEKIYASYGANEKLLGVAFEAKARGYADDVVILYGYEFNKECITGFKVLSSKETKGFGDQIDSGKTQKSLDFQKNFKCLSVRLNPEKTDLLHEITMKKSGANPENGEFDGISQATITSTAVKNMLIKSTEKIIPIIVNNLSVLENGNK